MSQDGENVQEFSSFLQGHINSRILNKRNPVILNYVSIND